MEKVNTIARDKAIVLTFSFLTAKHRDDIAVYIPNHTYMLNI